MAQGNKIIDSLEIELKKLDMIKRELGNKAPRLFDTTKVNILNELSRSYIGNDPDKAFDYSQQVWTISEQLEYKKGIANAFITFGRIHNRKGDFPLAMDYAFKAIKLFEEIKYKNGLAYANYVLGVIFNSEGNFVESHKYYQKSLKIYEELGDKSGIASAYNVIGDNFNEQKNYDDALKYLEKARKLFDEVHDMKGLSYTYNNIGEAYYQKGNYTEAIKNYFHAKVIEEQNGDKYGVAVTNNNIGESYSKQGEQTEALKLYLIALQSFEELGNKKEIAETYNRIAESFLKQNKNEEALAYETKSLDLSKEIGAKNNLITAYKNLAMIYFQKKNYEEAYLHQVLYIELKDSIFNNENASKITHLQMQYDFDKNAVIQKASQDKKDALHTLTNKIFIIGLLVLFALAIFIFGRYKIIDYQKEIIQIEKDRSDNLLLNILPVQIAKELKEDGKAEARNYEMVTVMFTDFKDFTRIAEQLSPSQLVEEIHTCFSAFDNIIHKHQIEKIKTIGDAYMCAGGLPLKNQTHAEDVVKAALEIREFMKEHNKKKIANGQPQFEIRIGVNSGPVVAGIVGVKKFAYDIWGDTVNLASRMESHGVVGEVNISGTTFELIKEKFPCAYRGKVEAKNKGEVDMYFVN